MKGNLLFVSPSGVRALVRSSRVALARAHVLAARLNADKGIITNICSDSFLLNV